MKKKGFMFVETIVTLTILMSLLLVLYTVFVNLLQKEKVNAEYDHFGERMSLFYYKESLGDSGIGAKLGSYSGFTYYDDSFGLDIIEPYCVQTAEKYKKCMNVLDGNGLESTVCGDEVDTEAACISSDLTSSTKHNCNVAIYKCKSDGTIDETNTGSDSGCLGISKDFENYRIGNKTCPAEAQYAIFGEFSYQEAGKTKYSYAHIYYPNINTAED